MLPECRIIKGKKEKRWASWENELNHPYEGHIGDI